MAIPGLHKENINVHLEKDQIQIKAENKEERAMEDGKFTRREFNYSQFSRNFILPKSVDKSSIDAHYENGVLRIVLNKKEEEKEQGIKHIDIT